MTGEFLDRYATLDSPLHRLDPRAKVVALILAVLIVSATPPDALWRFIPYYAAIATLILLSSLPQRMYFTRCAIASPFILLTSALPFISMLLGDAIALDNAIRLGAAVALKAYAAILLLTLLTATTGLYKLLWAFRKLGAPESVNLIAAMMSRYIAMLVDEYARMARARASRCARPMAGDVHFAVHGSQIAMLFIRSWERADRIHSAMLSRGFTGSMPVLDDYVFTGRDLTFTTATVALFAAMALL